MNNGVYLLSRGVLPSLVIEYFATSRTLLLLLLLQSVGVPSKDTLTLKSNKVLAGSRRTSLMIISVIKWNVRTWGGSSIFIVVDMMIGYLLVAVLSP